MPVLHHVLTMPLAETLPLLGLVLQQTDSANFSILNALIHLEPSLLRQALDQKSLKLFTALVRCLEAQPNLKKLINFSCLFAYQTSSNNQADLLLIHLQSLVCPERDIGEHAETKLQRMKLVDSLMLNKY